MDLNLSLSPLIPVAETFITPELSTREAAPADHLKEKLAIQDLARHMSDQPTEVLPRLVQLAMEMCGADSAGISVLEPASGEFRWHGLKGVLATFEGAKTPRNNSPCGLCLDVAGPILMDRPERAYDWIRDANITVPEVLLVPLALKDLDAMGTLWVVSAKPGHFNNSHARALGELSSFAAMALRTLQTEEHLKRALQEQEVLTREMSHRVKNLFALTASMIRMSRRGATSADDLADKLVGRIEALAEANGLVRRPFSEARDTGVPFGEIIGRIMRPYGYSKVAIAGPSVTVGQHSTNSIALIFHELATNAAKYGSLSTDQGSVAVNWATDQKDVRVSWTEAGGPITVAPASTGFGTRLIQSTVEGTGGDIDYQWAHDGLRAQLRLPLAALTY